MFYTCSSCDSVWTTSLTHKHTHTDTKIIDFTKPTFFHKATYSWHLCRSGKVSNCYCSLYTSDCLTTAVNTKVFCVGECVWKCVCITYSTVPSVVCESSWPFGMQRISHYLGPLQGGEETKWWKVNGKQKIKTISEICLQGRAGSTSSLKSGFSSFMSRKETELRGANVDSVISLESFVSKKKKKEDVAICWAAGGQKTLPTFKRLMPTGLLFKEESHRPSLRNADMTLDTDKGEERRLQMQIQDKRKKKYRFM